MKSASNRLALAMALSVTLAIAVTGCTAPTSAKMGTGTAAMGSDMSASGIGAKVVPAGYETCASYAGKNMAPMVDGAIVAEQGAQIADVGIANGYYTPNVFMAAAGTPIKVVFSGKASGCLAKPTFKSLGKSANFETSGSATIDLRALAPGTYEFSRSMDMVGGKVVVK